MWPLIYCWCFIVQAWWETLAMNTLLHACFWSCHCSIVAWCKFRNNWQVLLISQRCFFDWSTSLGGVLEDPVGMDPWAGCLLSDEYLMGLNGDLRLYSVALSFPTHNRRRRPFWLFPAGLCCFVLPCHTAAFDFIIAIAGRAVKQTTGMKAEAPRSLPLPRSCSPRQTPRAWTCHRQGQQITFHPWQGNGFSLHASPHTPGRMCQYLCPVGTRPVEKIKIFPLEEIWRSLSYQLEEREWDRADNMHLRGDLILHIARSITAWQSCLLTLWFHQGSM